MNARLMYVIDSLGAGGAERSLTELLPGIVAAGIDPAVAVFTRPDGRGEGSAGLGVPVRVIEATGRLDRIRGLRRLVASERPDLVHTTLFESDIAGRLAAAGRGTMVLTSLVNVPYSSVRLRDPRVRASRLRAARLIDGWTARHLTTHFHAVTHAVKREAVETLRIRPERITVIERGRDPERLGAPGPDRRAAARAALGLSADAEVVVTVGRQEFQKGHRHLLDAFVVVARARPRAVLLVAGRAGHGTAELEVYRSRLGLGDRIRFLGHRTDVPEVLAAADVFAFPSLYEGFGGAVIEAMALGLPVVTSDLEALREVVEPGETATLVPVGASDRMAEEITALLDDPARARAMGERGRAVFLERFTIERATARMVALYRRLLGERASARVGG